MAKSSIESVELIRHSLAHLLGAAVLDLYPGSKLAIGPAIDNGFYYDIDIPEKVSDGDLPQIETRMKELLKTWKNFEGKEVSESEVKKLFKGNPYKEELIDELSKNGEKITIYTSGNFTDLCRGGHVNNVSEIDPESFKLSHVAGAYWRGSEKNPQLTRIYGLAFENKKGLEDYMAMIKEAKKRDHRLIAQQLDLFSQHDIAPGAIFWHPKGMALWNVLENYIRSMNEKYGYGEVSTPVMVKKELFETSGHWEHYREDGFWFEVDKETYVLKPMNCPEGTLIYSNKLRSYKDLPIRLAEPTGKLHRNELGGVLGGLLRVRQFTQDDAHIFCRPDQIEEEVKTLINYTKELYSDFGLPISFSFATKPDKALGEANLWEKAEKALEDVLKKSKIRYELKPKDGAFYGPKIDIHVKDAIGREHQLATIQLDFQMPERFKLEYIDEKSQKVRPVMIHRAIFGSFERFIGLLIEHYAGAFPVWLSPIQVAVLPITDRQNKWAGEVVKELKSNGIRSEINLENETLGKKIREAEMQKIPYLLVIGDKEVIARTISVRKRGQTTERERGSTEVSRPNVGDIGQMKLEELTEKIKKEIEEKK